MIWVKPETKAGNVYLKAIMLKTNTNPNIKQSITISILTKPVFTPSVRWDAH